MKLKLNRIVNLLLLLMAVLSTLSLLTESIEVGAHYFFAQNAPFGVKAMVCPWPWRLSVVCLLLPLRSVS